MTGSPEVICQPGRVVSSQPPGLHWLVSAPPLSSRFALVVAFAAGAARRGIAAARGSTAATRATSLRRWREPNADVMRMISL